MKRVVKYETEDGQFFDTQEQAEAHERLKEIEKMYDKDAVYDAEVGSVDWYSLVSWVRRRPGYARDVVDTVIATLPKAE